MNLEEVMKKIRFKEQPVTMITILICVVVYMYTSLRYGLTMNAYQGQEVGGFNPILVLKYHEYYRLLSANFIHFGLMHVVCNCYSLYVLGAMMGLERMLGAKRYSSILLTAMLSTTVASCFLYVFFDTGANSILGGISGAVYGLIGAMLALAVLLKDMYMHIFKRIGSNVLVMLFISVIVPSISLVGHVAGMLGGFLAMVIIIKCFPLTIWRRYKEPKNDENHLVH